MRPCAGEVQNRMENNVCSCVNPSGKASNRKTNDFTTIVEPCVLFSVIVAQIHSV